MVSIYIVFAALGSIGITVFIMCVLLNRFHNAGDTFGSFYNYSTSIDMIAGTDPLIPGNTKEDTFMVFFGKSPFENDNTKAPDMLKKNDDDIYGELEEVDIPLFKPNS